MFTLLKAMISVEISGETVDTYLRKCRSRFAKTLKGSWEVLKYFTTRHMRAFHQVDGWNAQMPMKRIGEGAPERRV